MNKQVAAVTFKSVGLSNSHRPFIDVIILALVIDVVTFARRWPIKLFEIGFSGSNTSLVSASVSLEQFVFKQLGVH